MKTVCIAIIVSSVCSPSGVTSLRCTQVPPGQWGAVHRSHEFHGHLIYSILDYGFQFRGGLGHDVMVAYVANARYHTSSIGEQIGPAYVAFWRYECAHFPSARSVHPRARCGDSGSAPVDWHQPWAPVGEAKNPGPSVVYDRVDEGLSMEWGDLLAGAVPDVVEQVRRGERSVLALDEAEMELFLETCEREAGWARAGAPATVWQRRVADSDEMDRELAFVGAPAIEEEVDDTSASVSAASRCNRPTAAPPRGGRPRDGTLAVPRALLTDATPEIEEDFTHHTEAICPRTAPRRLPDTAAAAAARHPDLVTDPNARSRARGAGRGGDSLFLLANTNGKTQLLETLDRLRGRRSKVAALLNQEHWTPANGLADLTTQIKALGWKMAPAAATKGKRGGPSAGAGVVVPSHVGWSAPPGLSWDASPPGSAGRVAAAWVQTGATVGVLVISVYLWTGEGLTARNVALIERALWVARSYGALWIIGGDFNVAPAILRHQLDRLLSRAGAVVRAPAEETHYPSVGSPGILDYFLVDERLDSGFKHVEVSREFGLKPHRVVALTIDVGAVVGLKTVIREPRAFPRQKPQGCARIPTVPEQAFIDDCFSEDKGVDKLWGSVMDCVEHELCGVLDLVDQDGAPLAAYRGRGRPVETVQRPIVPPRVCGAVGRVDRVAHAMRWATVRVEELAHLAAKAYSNGGLAPAALLQWSRLQRIFVRSRGLIDVLVNHSDEWRALVGAATNCRLGDDPAHLRRILSEMEGRLAARKAEFAKGRGDAWKSWVAQQVRQGGGALHRYSKRVVDPAEVAVATADGPSALPQDKVEASAEEWKEIWHIQRGLATAPWRTEELGGPDRLPDIAAHELRRGSRSFKQFTGLGGITSPPPSYTAGFLMSSSRSARSS